jgi:3-hydroxyisobutyrate dehydrogenase-like beta-hydroxyacid dehydrogenase
MPNLSNPDHSAPHAILFVGLGTMGLPMASNLVRAGFRVFGSDTSRDAEERFLQAGGAMAGAARDFAHQAGIVVTMLPNDRIVREVLCGDDGILAVTRPGTLVIDMSTTSPATKTDIAAEAARYGIDFIESPVGKTVEHAIAGTLTLMAGGDPKLIDRARPVLSAMGSEIHVCGGIGAASTVKLINNALVACINAASLEALVAGQKAKVDLETMLGVFRTTLAWNNALAVGLPRKALKRDFKPGFMTKLAHKDVGLALAMADDLEVPMRLGRAAYEILEKALSSGFGDDDNAGSMMRVCEMDGGTTLVLHPPAPNPRA